jgi:alkylated DNA repair protein (DNA oxidative demethylase)
MVANGFTFLSEYLDLDSQQALIADIMAVSRFYRAVTPGGRPMSVEMSNLGPLGWITDARGYRYEPRHPITGEAWPPMPRRLLDLWADLADPRVPPDACLVNLYRHGARMGLHQDRDEIDFSLPVLSISLGDTAIFRLGGPRRGDPSLSMRLASGDVCLLAGEARLAYHAVDRILPGSSRLVPGGGRLNLTLRRARP